MKMECRSGLSHAQKMNLFYLIRFFEFVSHSLSIVGQIQLANERLANDLMDDIQIDAHK